MKRFFIILLVCAITANVQAQSVKKKQKSRPKVGVVLGGGGAKGASHIGVLKYIEEVGIPVDYVAGTSMGSIIGGLYAMGYDPDEMTTLISNIPWNEYIGNKIDRTNMSTQTRWRNSTLMLSIPFSLESLRKKESNASFLSSLPSAYVSNSALVNLFNDLSIGYQEYMDFDKMPIPFACVATNLIDGNEVVLRKGVVPVAMRASMAIPGVFAPVEIDNMVLVDGGLVNNFPADVLREMGADIIIGVEVTSEKDVTSEQLKSLPQVMGRLLTNITNAKRKENRELCDIRIVPDVSGYGMLSFTPDAIRTLVGRGYEKAEQYHDQLMDIKQRVDKAAGHRVTKTLHAPKSLNLINDSVLITKIGIHGIDNSDNSWMARKGGLQEGNLYSKTEIEDAINIFRGTSCFDEITYKVVEIDSIHTQDTSSLSESYALDISLNPAKPNVVGLGARYDTEEGAALLVSIGLNEKAFNGHKFSIIGKLSYSPRLNLKYTYSRRSLANFNLAYEYRNEHFGMPDLTQSNKSFNLHYKQNKLTASISEFHLLNLSTTVGVSTQRVVYDLATMDGSYLDSTCFATNKLTSPFITVIYDNLDDDYFAKQGIYARLNTHFNFIHTTHENSFDLSYAFNAYLTPKDSYVTFIPQLYGRFYLNDPVPYNLWTQYGGEIAGRHFEDQLPFIGIIGVQTANSNVSILRCDIRCNFVGKHYLTGMYNYLMDWTMTPYGFKFALQQGVHGAGIKYSYRSAVGPISLTFHWTRSYGFNHFGSYFSFGYTF